MGHRRRRHGHFRRRLRTDLGLEIFEILHLDAAGRPGHAVDHIDRQRRLFLAALLRLLALQDGAADGEVGLDPTDPADEVDMEALAPEFAVGDGLYADCLLLLHHVRDGGVFAPAKVVRTQSFVLPLLAGFEQRFRAQQAADMVGAKRRFHRNSFLLRHSVRVLPQPAGTVQRGRRFRAPAGRPPFDTPRARSLRGHRGCRGGFQTLPYDAGWQGHRRTVATIVRSPPVPRTGGLPGCAGTGTDSGPERGTRRK